jgi:hypothetical protein
MFRQRRIAVNLSTTPESNGLDIRKKALLRSIDSDCLAHRMLPRAAPKRRHVFVFDPRVIDATAPMRGNRDQSDIHVQPSK